eukprot:g58439.t1
MGISHPVSSVALHRKSNELYQAGVASVQGFREEMEDYHSISLAKHTDTGDSAASFFGVFDGHGGTRTAQFCAESLHAYVTRDVATDEAIAKSCLAADAELRKVYHGIHSSSKLDSQTEKGKKKRKSETKSTSQEETSPESGSTGVFCIACRLPDDAPVANIHTIQQTFFTLQGSPDPHSGPGALGLDQPFSSKEPDAGAESGEGGDDDDAAPPPPPPDSAEKPHSSPHKMNEPPPPPPAFPDDEAPPAPPSDDPPPAPSDEPKTPKTRIYTFHTEEKKFQGPRRRLIVGNVGDSRCVLGHEGTGVALALSKDHKPTQARETRRIVRAGGEVKREATGPPRVDGVLAVCRAFGDFTFKNNSEHSQSEQKVIVVPDFKIVETNDTRHFVFLGCDGVFDVLSNEEVVSFVVAALKKQRTESGKVDAAAVMKELALFCIEKG